MSRNILYYDIAPDAAKNASAAANVVSETFHTVPYNSPYNSIQLIQRTQITNNK
ncbi:hypothetical protein FACS1894219_12900 [Clostridia bacterium]|nr:hypothetical protein FACS1894219_12900 [Clostridia bacterium]